MIVKPMLKILYGVGQYLVVPMAKEEAAKIISNWRKGELPKFLCDKEDSWCIKSDSIVGMHQDAVQLEQTPAGMMPSAGLPGVPGQGGWGLSGR